MHFFSALFRIFADNMQILLASAKIMNDKVSVQWTVYRLDAMALERLSK